MFAFEGQALGQYNRCRSSYCARKKKAFLLCFATKIIFILLLGHIVGGVFVIEVWCLDYMSDVHNMKGVDVQLLICGWQGEPTHIRTTSVHFGQAQEPSDPIDQCISQMKMRLRV